MRNRPLIIGITIFVTLFCFYCLSFTFRAREIQDEATTYATAKDGSINLEKKQDYLDSLYERPAYSFLGMIDYTYKEVKEMELALGLDLQGGMHVTLEVSPVEILKALAGGNASDPRFKSALNTAIQQSRTSTEELSTLFFRAFREANGPDRLQSIFANSVNRGDGISSSSTDKDIEKFINGKVSGAINNSFEILRNRIDKFGAIQPNIQKVPGTDRIQVELPGVENRKRVRNMLEGTAQLQFFMVYHIHEVGQGMEQFNAFLLARQKGGKDTTNLNADNGTSTDLSADDLSADDDTAATAKSDSTKKNDTASAKQDTTKQNQASEFYSLMQAGPRQGIYYLPKDTMTINRLLALPQAKSFFPSDMVFMWERKASKLDKNSDGPEVMELLPLKTEKGGKPALGGDVIRSARAEVFNAQYVISMTMKSEGAQKWKNITKKAAVEQQRRVAIVMDGVVYSAPNVREEIPNGSSQISGNFTQEEATDLANILESGKLPAPVRIVEEVIVGPTLGKEAISSGMMSMLAGLVLVVLLMIMYYSKGGVIANIALLFNIIFILGLMASINSVLTLPGIAGIVLTIGMSVDANVLIFERIREELRNGKSLRTAIEAGYDKAFSSIFDSNITTILIGVILLWLGSGPAKGFAITLVIGIATSFFTAVYLSKAILLFVLKDKDEKSVTFSTVFSKNLFQNLNFNIIGKRKIAYVFSGILIIAGFVTIFMQGGLNLGVDFKGGRSYVVQLKDIKPTSDLREALEPNFNGTPTEVKTFGSASKVKITTSYLIEDESSEADSTVEVALVKGLDQSVGAGKYEIQYSNKVGATIADDIKATSWKSGLLSLFAIFIYILFRFRKWQYSLGGVVALAHDSIMIVCIFSILRLFGISYEVDQVFVAAILTIIGFSINDTVIVFDRVREFTKEFGTKHDLETVINNSINHTLSRTIMTTVTVLVVVLTLFLFGGESLRGFSFALLIGVVFGSYSTIFIAIPMVLDLRSKAEKDRDKQLAKNAAAKINS